MGDIQILLGILASSPLIGFAVGWAVGWMVMKRVRTVRRLLAQGLLSKVMMSAQKRLSWPRRLGSDLTWGSP